MADAFAYADTSVLVSAYVEDRHSNTADRLLQSGPRVFVTPLHVAEWTHAVMQHVFRGEITLSTARRLEREFAGDRLSGAWIEAEMPEGALVLCQDLARRHGADLPIRTLDSLHVACALELKLERFWTFDERQERLAMAVGLKP